MPASTGGPRCAKRGPPPAPRYPSPGASTFLANLAQCLGHDSLRLARFAPPGTCCRQGGFKFLPAGWPHRPNQQPSLTQVEYIDGATAGQANALAPILRENRLAPLRQGHGRCFHAVKVSYQQLSVKQCVRPNGLALI